LNELMIVDWGLVKSKLESKELTLSR